MSNRGENDPSIELRHAEYIRHAIEQVKDLRGTQGENLGTVLGPSDPKQVGPYRILSVLGKGGMGKVYLAEQQPPLRRRVALKVIKADLDSEQVLARFEAERQALALLDHSNIAKVFDAGTTEEGRPYFVMEYIEGERITEYCDRHQLDTPARLRLFMQVCEGVQHAHQKAIIHRDIKPSNILVTEQDGKPVPKIIDFGVAKATEQKLTERSLQTEIGQIIGTLGYMSREQLRTPHDVDTRTDIYSLGVVLYELLVGELPFDPSTLRRGAKAEMERIIAEEEPLKPSTKLSSLEADSWGVVASKRDTAFRSLYKTLRGDLDWITMKAMEKDRIRRYDTANGLALEIQRYLNNEPVLAGPPSATYRLRKFLRRNKGVVAAVGTIIAALATGLIVSDFQRRRAVYAETLAAFRLKEADDKANRLRRVLSRYSILATKSEVVGDRPKSVEDWARNLLNLAEPSEAIAVARAFFEHSASHREEKARYAAGLELLARVLAATGQLEEAQARAEELNRFVERDWPAINKHTIDTRLFLASLQARARHFHEAEHLLVDSYCVLTEARGHDDRHTHVVAVHLAMLYESWQAAEPGKGYADKAAEWRSKLDDTLKTPSTGTSNEQDVGTPNGDNAEGSKNDDRQAPK